MFQSWRVQPAGAQLQPLQRGGGAVPVRRARAQAHRGAARRPAGAGRARRAAGAARQPRAAGAGGPPAAGAAATEGGLQLRACAFCADGVRQRRRPHRPRR